MQNLGRNLRAMLLAATAMAAPALAPAAFAAGTLTVTLVQDPGSWDPIDTFLVNWAKVGNNVFDGLVQRGPDMKLAPGLATSWEQSEDGKRIRFKLRENVKFHNGEPFDAEAVRFTFERLLGAEGAKGPQQSNYNAIDKVEVVDATTVDFLLKNPDPVLITKLAGYGGMIVPPKYIQEKGDEYFNTHPVGTGPFKVVDYQPKVSVTLEPFAEHWGGKPKLDKVVFRFIAEPSTQVAELQAGRVDIVTDPLPISAIPIVNSDPRLKVESITGPTVQALRFNTRTGITKDETVRKALIMAVDRDAIIKQMLGGQAKPIASFQSELSFGYDPALKPLPFDPAKAKQLLAQAGVKPGAAVQIDFRGSDANFREAAQAVAGYLQAVGIKSILKPYETNVILNEIIPAGKTGEMFQQGWGGWTFDYDNTAYLMYHSGEKWNPYDNIPELNALLESQRSMTDRSKREKVLQEIGRVVADKALEMPLYNLNAVYGVSKRVKNFVAPPDSRLRLTDVTVD
ncbi:ABC transporter substrate-binding protein [Chelatococcus sp. SYSU_G07232]|uniref:ABC transporter substrate-binding protein n=1 Tax=Chelatococcus albus TaxID=3047466 RepID=A0ABT7AC41_9HYPH|nr:ABC transporter substrate-binding protein [Chelatococcus sp. SYSU_G07232]MDJ1156655.1 ABC transporter substrate-binding protein [Chelatococcus sp. SYSU_G07232]